MACFSIFHAVQGRIESTRPLTIVKRVIVDHYRGQNACQNHYFYEKTSKRPVFRYLWVFGQTLRRVSDLGICAKSSQIVCILKPRRDPGVIPPIKWVQMAIFYLKMVIFRGFLVFLAILAK
jgi:hypothetical protein